MPKKQTQEFKEKGKLVSNRAPQITTQTMKTHEIQTKDAARPRLDLREQKGASSDVSLPSPHPEFTRMFYHKLLVHYKQKCPVFFLPFETSFGVSKMVMLSSHYGGPANIDG